MATRFAPEAIQQIGMQQLYAIRGDAMDLRPSCSGVEDEHPPPASCYDAGLATDADVDAKFSPVRTYVPTYSDYSVSEEDSEEECTSEDEDHSISRLPAPAPPPTDKYKEYLFHDKVLSFTGSSIKSRESRIKVNQWVATWKELDEDGRRWTWIHVYAYYSKKKCHGGYGVILLDALGKPIVASANFSTTGVSFYYQVFKGIDVGVRLAEGFNLSDLRVRCNSPTVPAFFRELSICPDDQCKNAKDHSGICKRCNDSFFIRRCDSCEMVVPLVLKLRQKNPRELSSSWDLAAHYVAKIKRKKVLEVEKKKEAKMKKNKIPKLEKLDEEESSSTSDDGSLFRPHDFPRELQNVLWGSSFSMKRMVMMKK